MFVKTFQKWINKQPPTPYAHKALTVHSSENEFYQDI